jgi:hypothetical protein
VGEKGEKEEKRKEEEREKRRKKKKREKRKEGECTGLPLVLEIASVSGSMCSIKIRRSFDC